MDTFKTLLRLSNMTSKNDYLNHVWHELNTVSQVLQQAGYSVNINSGMIQGSNLQSINAFDFVNCWYFNELYFIYHGLSGNGWTYDPMNRLYFIGLQGFVTSQYNQLP